MVCVESRWLLRLGNFPIWSQERPATTKSVFQRRIVPAFFRSAIHNDMTFFCRQPLRLLPRLAATKTHASAIRSQVSAVRLLQNRFASKVSDASPKSSPRPYAPSASEVVQKLGMATLYCIVLVPCTDASSVSTAPPNIQCSRSRGCYDRYLQARRLVHS